MTVTAPALHVPDEPTARAEVWLDAVLDGNPLEATLTGPEGLSSWLWQRWSALSAAGLSRQDFDLAVLDYRRELWLWLAGERTWTQACSGLVGRLTRRLQRDLADPA